MKISRSLIRILMLLSVFTFYSPTFEAAPSAGGSATVVGTYSFMVKTQGGLVIGGVITLFDDGNMVSILSTLPPGTIQGSSGRVALSSQQGAWKSSGANSIQAQAVGVVSDPATDQFKGLALVQYTMQANSSTGSFSLAGFGAKMLAPAAASTGSGTTNLSNELIQEFQVQPSQEFQLQPD